MPQSLLVLRAVEAVGRLDLLDAGLLGALCSADERIIRVALPGLGGAQ
jgi:hypothetical protein